MSAQEKKWKERKQTNDGVKSERTNTCCHSVSFLLYPQEEDQRLTMPVPFAT